MSDDTGEGRAERNRRKDDHGVERGYGPRHGADADADGANPEDPEAAATDDDPGREDADGEAREGEAADRENPDAHRDESPYQ